MNQKNQLLQSLRVSIETRKKQIQNLEQLLTMEDIGDKGYYENKLITLKKDLVSLENELRMIR